MKALALVVVTAAFAGGPVNDSPSRARAPKAVAVEVRQDAADSLYRAARDAMSRGDYSGAASLFQRIASQYPNSSVADQAMYYQAFSLYRQGGAERLKTARKVLDNLKTKYPDFARGEPASLRTRICGELAKQGDEACAAEVTRAASEVTGRAARAESDAKRGSSSGTRAGCPNENDDDDERIQALNALLQMDADRAMPILKQVLDRRDGCSVALRRKAVFLVSQKNTSDAADILLKAARNDPDGEVRQQAVFWLSQVRDERAVDMLEDILRNSKDEELQNKALFALSQHRSGRGSAILREFATRDGTSTELRGQAIFWLGQRNSQENNDFLRNLYGKLNNQELKDKVLFSLSQRRNMGNEKWLMQIAANGKEDIELRKKALFWAGQSGVGVEEIIPFYTQIPDQEMREQVIFVLSQRGNNPRAVDKLMDIAKNDKDPELRKKAIFWLGQSRDPRVQQFLVDMINR
jgi:TolA-binding protein